MPPLADSTRLRTRTPPTSHENGASLQSDHLSDSIDTEVTKSPLDVLTNNPSTPRVNGSQNVVPVITNVTRGSTHSTLVVGTPVIGGPPITNLKKTYKGKLRMLDKMTPNL